jgi:O-antigen ligase
MIGHGYKNGFMIVNSKFNHNFNAHNQYLQALFHSGIIGFFLLILFSISPFIFKRKKIKSKYGFEFLIYLILFNFLFETLLFRQWGLIYVSFIYAVYFQFYKKDFKWFR